MLYQIEQKIEEWNKIRKECATKTVMGIADESLREQGNEALRIYHACVRQINDLKILRRKIELNKTPSEDIKQEFAEKMQRTVDNIPVCEDRFIPNVTFSDEEIDGQENI